jgi:hypothetical protein
VAYFRFASSKPKKGKGSEKTESPVPALVPTENPEATPTTLASKPQFIYEGAKGKLLKAYVKAVNAVERATECVLAPDMTLREFLHETREKTGDAAQPFTELTDLAERTLYAPFIPEAQHIAKAENLAETIRRSLQK